MITVRNGIVSMEGDTEMLINEAAMVVTHVTRLIEEETPLSKDAIEEKIETIKAAFDLEEQGMSKKEILERLSLRDVYTIDEDGSHTTVEDNSNE